MGSLAGLMGAGAPIAQGATQGQLQGTQEQLNLQQAQKQRDLSQQSIDVERLKAMAELTGPARGEALKRALELEQGKPDNYGYWESQVAAGNMNRWDADKAEHVYQQQIDGYKSFGLGTDANSSGVAGLHQPGANVDSSVYDTGAVTPTIQRVPIGSNPPNTPPPPGLGQNAPALGTNGPSSNTPNPPPSSTPEVKNLLGTTLGMALGNAGVPFGGSIGQAAAGALPAPAPTAPVPATTPVPPAVLPNTSPAPLPIVTPDSKSAVPSVPVADGPRADEHTVYQAGGISVVSGPNGTRVIDPKGVLTPWTQADTESYIANDKGVQAAQSLVTGLSAQVEAARQFGPPSTALMKSLQDAQDKLVAAQESAVTRAQGEATIRSNTITAFYAGYSNAGGGTAQFAQANRTGALLPGEQAKQDADLAYTRAQTAYQTAQTDAEKQTARQAMYDADLKRLQLKNYPAEEAQKLAQTQVAIDTARITKSKTDFDFRMGKLKTQDSGLVDNYEGMYGKLTDRDINSARVGPVGFRFGGSDGGDAIYADKAYAAVKGSEKYLNDSDPDIKAMATRIHSEALQALRNATGMIAAGAANQVKGAVPSTGAWLGRDIWSDLQSRGFTGAAAKPEFIKEHGGNPKLPTTRQGLQAMDLWTNFYYVMNGTGATIDRYAFAQVPPVGFSEYRRVRTTSK